MLAEPRRRQKYSVNPRGLDWSNDDAKVGQKLLEKMGWRKGKALGLNEDGCKEHIKVSTKSDRKGVGCTQQQADNWIAHQEDFNSILSALNKDVSTETPAAAFSLHDKSKNSRSRVHYQKFAKGKDLSSYHSTDLNCIFGERKQKLQRTEQQRTDEIWSESSAFNSNEKRSFGVLTVTSSTSIDHYFANKLASLRSKAEHNKPISESVSQLASDSLSNCDATRDEHREQTKQQLKPRVSSETDSAVDSDVVTVKRRKKKQQNSDSVCCTNDKPVHSVSLDYIATAKKKKKKKKQSDKSDVEVVPKRSNDSQTQKTAETTQKNKKRLQSTQEAMQLNQLKHNDITSKKQKKSRHVSSDTR